MRSRLKPAVAAVISAFLFQPAIVARADIKNRNLLPVGEKETFRGNSGTGVSGSPGSAFYNPAGLASLKGVQLSASGSTYMYFDKTTDKFAVWDGTDLAYKEFGFASIPGTLVATWAGETWVYAFSIISPGTLTLRNRSAWDTPNSRVMLMQMSDSQEMWFGLSAARELGDGWSAGATLFGIYTTLSSISTRQIKPTTPTIFRLLVNQAFVESTVYNLAAALGVMYEAHPSWRLGMRVTTPSVKLSGKTDYLSHTETVGMLGTPNESETVLEDADTNYQIPLDVSLGVTIWPKRPFKLFLDLSHQSEVSYDTVPGSAISTRPEYASTMRYNLGGELVMTESTSWQWGLMYNPSALDASRGAENKDDFYGATTGMFYETANTRLGAGVFYIWSNGEVVTVFSGEKSPSQTRIIGASLSTGYRF
ncbi:MAG TPA: hypothetical protein VFV50_04885 [Bdellovibrionales bacterium]|nr:hypothetical protein [Bdellovibrionales bacterium]